jgi:nodulation protein E
MGIISALGKNVAENWESLASGRSAIGPITVANIASLKFQNGAEVAAFNPDDYFPGNEADFLDRFAQFAIVAAREAIAASALDFRNRLSEKTTVITGSSIGGQSSQDAGFWAVYHERQNRVHPLTIPRTMPNAGASAISMEFGIRGPAYNISTACSSSNHAIGQAFWAVRSGLAEIAVTGGCEAPLSFGILKAWEAMRVVSPDTCRPFSRERRGMILGEGAAMFVLEPLDAARARGARILGEIVGFGMSSDASHITKPAPEGAAAAIRKALEDAQLRLDQIGYINAHGTGTQVNDPMETTAIRTVFGEHADKLPISSTKSMHGHALGAAGSFEAVATIMALANGTLPPTANYTTPDPECNLDVIPNQARHAKVEFALSNSFAFGGLNAVLAFRRAE